MKPLSQHIQESFQNDKSKEKVEENIVDRAIGEEVEKEKPSAGTDGSN